MKGGKKRNVSAPDYDLPIKSASTMLIIFISIWSILQNVIITRSHYFNSVLRFVDIIIFFLQRKRSLCQHKHFFYSYFQAEDIHTTTNFQMDDWLADLLIFLTHKRQLLASLQTCFGSVFWHFTMWVLY